MASVDSVRPTAVTASLLFNLLIKKISTTASNDSIAISKIMGMDNMNIALLMLPSVKFCSSPLTACLNRRNSETVFVKNFMCVS